MSGVSLPVTRPSGRALVVANPAGRAQPTHAMASLGFECADMDDPYAAMAELCRRPLVYRALVLSLASLYREELQLIPTVKRRFPHIEIWLTQLDGRQGALAEAMRLGADGLLGEDGLHRIAIPAAASPEPAPVRLNTTVTPLATQNSGAARAADDADDIPMNEPVLTADELRALLQEQPSFPPMGGEEE
jgi:hypothetical protein